jgi:sulfite reductase (ferredoxin)
MPEQLANEIDAFEAQIELRKAGKIDEKVFAETRLRRGSYGQRYDNGHRHDGVASRQIEYPTPLTKGPDTLWDAPGMQRIKIPFGGLSCQQMDLLAELAEEYSDGILHVTTRQDFQLHFVHIEDTPELMRRLASVGITTREACGNSVRNVTGCIYSGVCCDESFDVTPYAKAMAYFLLGHPDTQDFGRKFKIAFSGCRDNACALVNIHDLGFIAKTQWIDGREKRGFEVYAGGGLGPVPYQAKLLEEFTPEEEILPLAQAVSRVFARLGEKRIRSRARIKFLVAKLGIDEFRRLVRAERQVLPHDDRWTAYLAELPHYRETPVRGPASLDGRPWPVDFAEWHATNVRRQRQEGYAVVEVTLPLGDMTSEQMRRLADLARKYSGDNVRTTVEQNVILRWVPQADLPELHTELKAIGLGQPGAGTIVDVTSCPGTDTCKLGIASSRGLAGELRTRLAAKNAGLDDAIRNLKVKVSGCFNSCGQHHIADLGFFGASRKVGKHTVPHFQVVVGGKWSNNAGAYGLAVGTVPSKAVPEVLDAITDRYLRERNETESFQDWIERFGKKALRALIEPFMVVPSYGENRFYYTDWGDPREFTTGDLAVGECAGEVVSLYSLEIVKAESEAFEAQIDLDEGNYRKADERAYRAMLLAAKALIRTQFLDIGDDPDTIVAEFRRRFFDTQMFLDKYVGPKFANFFFARHEAPIENPDRDAAHRIVEEAQLFVEATHACEARMSGMTTGGVKL